MQPITSEFSYIWVKFSFLYNQCGTLFGLCRPIFYRAVHNPDYGCYMARQDITWPVETLKVSIITWWMMFRWSLIINFAVWAVYTCMYLAAFIKFCFVFLYNVEGRTIYEINKREATKPKTIFLFIESQVFLNSVLNLFIFLTVRRIPAV